MVVIFSLFDSVNRWLHLHYDRQFTAWHLRNCKRLSLPRHLTSVARMWMGKLYYGKCLQTLNICQIRSLLSLPEGGICLSKRSKYLGTAHALAFLDSSFAVGCVPRNDMLMLHHSYQRVPTVSGPHYTVTGVTSQQERMLQLRG